MDPMFPLVRPAGATRNAAQHRPHWKIELESRSFQQSGTRCAFLQIEVPGNQVRSTGSQRIHLVEILIEAVDGGRIQHGWAQAVGGIAPVAVQSHLVEVNFQGIPILGFLDIERPHKRIAALGVNVRMLDMANAKVVLSSGVPGPRDHGISGFDPKHRVLEGGKNSRVVGRINLVRGTQAALHPSKQSCDDKSPTNAYFAIHHHRVPRRRGSGPVNSRRAVSLQST